MAYFRGRRVANLVSRDIPSERQVARYASRPAAPRQGPHGPKETNHEPSIQAHPRNPFRKADKNMKTSVISHKGQSLRGRWLLVPLVIASTVLLSCDDEAAQMNEPPEDVVVESRPIRGADGKLSVQVTSNGPIDPDRPLVFRTFDVDGNLLSEVTLPLAMDLVNHGPSVVLDPDERKTK